MRETGAGSQLNQIRRDEIYNRDHISPSQNLRHHLGQAGMNARVQSDHLSDHPSRH